MRLIDADALRAQMYHEAFETDSDDQRWDSGCWIRYKMFERVFDNAPTIEERKTGRLIDANPYGKCSRCGWLIDIRDGFNYCPHCGCKMEDFTI